MAVIINGSTGITNVNGSASTPAETGTDTDTGIYYGTNTVGLATNGTNALFIDASQNVGIGTSSPSARVDNTGTFRSTGATDPSSGTGLELSYRSTYGDVLAYNRTSSSFVQLQIRGEPIIFGNSGGERMRIDSSGNVAVGTTATTYNYQTKNIALYDATSAGISIASGSKVLTLTSQSSGGIFVGSRSNDNLIFITNDTERARIDSSGNLLVGTTSVPSTGAGTNSTIVSNKDYSASFAQIINSTSTSGTQSFIQFGRGSSECGKITSTATNSTTYATSSDYRLKENISPMTGALVRVAALKPVSYRWKSDGTESEGFIAHELAEVVPQAVVGEKDALYEDGTINPQGIDTSFLVATLTAAIQEQQALITAMTARIEALEAK